MEYRARRTLPVRRVRPLDRCSSNDTDDTLSRKAKNEHTSTRHAHGITRVCKRSKAPTGGNSLTPVSLEYCRNMSPGFGPRKTKMSITPDSDIQCVSTCGTSLDPLNRFKTLLKIP